MLPESFGSNPLGIPPYVTQLATKLPAAHDRQQKTALCAAANKK